MAAPHVVRRVQRLVLVVAALAVLGMASGGLSGAPEALAIHAGNEPADGNTPWE